MLVCRLLCLLYTDSVIVVVYALFMVRFVGMVTCIWCCDNCDLVCSEAEFIRFWVLWERLCGRCIWVFMLVLW